MEYFSFSLLFLGPTRLPYFDNYLYLIFDFKYVIATVLPYQWRNHKKFKKSYNFNEHILRNVSLFLYTILRKLKYFYVKHSKIHLEYSKILLYTDQQNELVGLTVALVDVLPGLAPVPVELAEAVVLQFFLHALLWVGTAFELHRF